MTIPRFITLAELPDTGPGQPVVERARRSSRNAEISRCQLQGDARDAPLPLRLRPLYRVSWKEHDWLYRGQRFAKATITSTPTPHMAAAQTGDFSMPSMRPATNSMISESHRRGVPRTQASMRPSRRSTSRIAYMSAASVPGLTGYPFCIGTLCRCRFAGIDGYDGNSPRARFKKPGRQFGRKPRFQDIRAPEDDHGALVHGSRVKTRVLVIASEYFFQREPSGIAGVVAVQNRTAAYGVQEAARERFRIMEGAC